MKKVYFYCYPFSGVVFLADNESNLACCVNRGNIMLYNMFRIQTANNRYSVYSCANITTQVSMGKE